MHHFNSPRPEPCSTCGGLHIHCPYCGHPAIIWPTPGAVLIHHCVRCGGPVQTGTPSNSGPWGPVRGDTPGSRTTDPLAADRQKLEQLLHQSPDLPQSPRVPLPRSGVLGRVAMPHPHHRPCPPSAERLTLAEWYRQTGVLPEPGSVAAAYRRLFGGRSPRKHKQTCIYSRRELQLLGVITSTTPTT